MSDENPDNVVQIPTAFNMQRQDVVATIEEVLERARRGEVESVAIGVVCTTGAIATTFSTSSQTGAQLGAVALLQARLARVLLGAGQ